MQQAAAIVHGESIGMKAEQAGERTGRGSFAAIDRVLRRQLDGLGANEAGPAGLKFRQKPAVDIPCQAHGKMAVQP